MMARSQGFGFPAFPPTPDGDHAAAEYVRIVNAAESETAKPDEAETAGQADEQDE